MKVASPYNLLQADAKSLYKHWCDDLRLLREVTEKSAQQMYIDSLTEHHAKAQELLNTDQLNSQTLPMMKVILSRPVKDWVVLHRNPNSPIIPSFR